MSRKLWTAFDGVLALAVGKDSSSMLSEVLGAPELAFKMAERLGLEPIVTVPGEDGHEVPVRRSGAYGTPLAVEGWPLGAQPTFGEPTDSPRRPCQVTKAILAGLSVLGSGCARAPRPQRERGRALSRPARGTICGPLAGHTSESTRDQRRARGFSNSDASGHGGGSME
jgi:hypothetical protein